MLDFFRHHAGSWLIKAALFLIVIVFVFWGGYSLKSNQENQVASIDGQYISIAEYNHAYDQMLETVRRQAGSNFSQELVKQLGLKQRALEGLIDRYLISKASQELGLAASPQEVQQAILRDPAFQTDGKFDQKRYMFMLQQYRFTPEAYEQQMATHLSQTKLEAFVKRMATVTDEDILADFGFNNTLAQLSYVVMEPKSFEGRVVADDKALQTFFEGHSESYKEPEKRQLPFVLFKTEEYSKDIKVTDDQVKNYYADHQSEYHKAKEVRARHILFTVNKDAPKEEEEKVRLEAQKVLDMAVQGQDFSELAVQYSQDPSVAMNRGDLGYFPRKKMVPAFSDAAFALKPGEISGLVRTSFGFHIIKVEDVKPEKTITLEEAREQIEKSIRLDAGREIAYVKARDFSDSTFALRDLEKAATNLKLQVNGIDAWVGPGDGLPDLKKEESRKAVSKLFEMPEKDVSKALDVPSGFVVAQIKAIQAPRVPAFEEVKIRVDKDYKKEQEVRLARQSATTLLASAKEMNSIEKAAKEKGIQVKTSAWFSRSQPDKEVRLTAEAQSQIFQLAQTHPFPEAPIGLANGFLVCQLLGAKTPEGPLEKERDAIYGRVLAEKQNQIWQSWITQLRQRADVKILKEI
jgi:peptidyl-prolyl cis-trans isomerase D